MSANGLLSAKQIRDVTGNGSTPSFAGSYDALATDRDLYDILAGTATLHPGSLPIKVGNGLVYDSATDNAIELSIDGSTLTAPGGVLTVTSVAGLEIAAADLDRATNSGLSITAGTGDQLAIGAQAPLAVSGSNLSITNATTSAVGVANFPAAGGLSISSGAVSINLGGTGTGTIDSGTLRLSAGNVLGVATASYVDRSISSASTLQSIASGLDIAGANGSSVAINLSNPGGAIIRGVLDPAGDTDAAPRLWIQNAISTAVAGLNDPIAPANDFINAANSANGAIVTNGRYVALEADIESLGNAVGDILVAIADNDIAGATVLDGGVDFADGSLMNIGDELGVATASVYGPGLYKYDDGTPVWGFLVAAPGTVTAVNNYNGSGTSGTGTLGSVIPNNGLSINSTTGILNVNLASTSGLEFDGSLADNQGLRIDLAAGGGGLTLTGGLQIDAAGIVTAMIGTDQITADLINWDTDSCMTETGSTIRLELADSSLSRSATGVAVATGGIGWTQLNGNAQHFADGGSNEIDLFLNSTYLTSDGSGVRPVAGASGAGPLNATHLDLGNGLEATNSGVDESIQLKVSSSFDISSGTLTIAAKGITNTMINLASDTDASGLTYTTVGGAVAEGYRVKVDGTTILCNTTAGVRVGSIGFSQLTLATNAPIINNTGIDISIDDVTLENNSGTLQVHSTKYKQRAYFVGGTLPSPTGGGNTKTYTFDVSDTYVSGSVRIWVNDLEVDSSIITEPGATTVAFTANEVNATTEIPYLLTPTADFCVTIEYNVA